MVVRAASETAVSPFAALLPSLEVSSPHKSSQGRLGKTAEGLQKLHEEARAAGHLEGYEAGHAEGREAGFQAVREEMAVTVDAFAQALDGAAQRVQNGMADWYAAAEQSLGELSVAIAARILGRELALGSDAITSLVREAVQELTTADKIRIRVNPFDAPILGQEKALVLSANASLRSVEIVEDPSISGGARIESDSGVIDATIRTQLELAMRAIRGVD